MGKDDEVFDMTVLATIPRAARYSMRQKTYPPGSGWANPGACAQSSYPWQDSYKYTTASGHRAPDCVMMKSTRDFFEGDKNPGPGQYEIECIVGREVVGGDIGKAERGSAFRYANTPGANAYSIPQTSKSPIFKHEPTFTLGLKCEIPGEKYKAPGPGVYNVFQAETAVRQKAPGFSFSRAPRGSAFRESHTPGAGAYGKDSWKSVSKRSTSVAFSGRTLGPERFSGSSGSCGLLSTQFKS